MFSKNLTRTRNTVKRGFYNVYINFKSTKIDININVFFSVSVESAVEEVVSTSPPPPTITRSHPVFEMPRTQEQKDVIKRKWQAILGNVLAWENITYNLI